MGIPIRCSQQAKTQKSNNVCRDVRGFFLILVILLGTGCAPSVKVADPVDPQVTQTASIAPAETLPALTVTGSNTAVQDSPTPTPSAIALPTNTQLPSFTLTFIPGADAFVKQSEPHTNFGKKTSLQVDSGSDPDETFIQFEVTDLSGTIQSAVLRLYSTKNGSQNGPLVSKTNAPWSEGEITWSKRPISGDDALDNKDEINTESWVEYDVTAAVTGNGTINFILTADSEDAITFSSREGAHPPELVVTFIPDFISNLTPTPLSFAEAVTLVGAGDISMCGNDNDELTAELIESIPGTVFTTGDNAYTDGEYTRFIDCYDPTWGRFKYRTYPIPGNHDYDTPDGAGYFLYFENIPSYYAYDLGGWRIYALNSEIDVSKDSPQVKWLEEDLATHPTQCVLAYWHEPRWSSGSTHGNSKGKQTLWKTFYEAGAELVLNGHEHNYERFTPMDAEGQPDPLGLREIVVGTGGGTLYPFGAPLATTEVRNNTTYGVLKLSLHPDSYDWEFIPVAGSTFTDSGSTECH